MSQESKYTFSWDLLGDIAKGRPNLGPTTHLAVYRLMQFSFRDVLERELGTAKTDEIFYRAGYLAGMHFYTQLIGPCADFNTFVKKLQEILREMKIGIMRVEMADIEAGHFTITISEDLDCSGLPELNYEVCTYDEGFIAALLESYTGRHFRVKEVDCWCTGDRTCRFKADAVGELS